MATQFQDLASLIMEEQEAALAKTRAEIAAEKAAWDALPQSERDRIQAERDAMYADCPGIDDLYDDEDEEDENDESEDEE
jgi:hypothetical protein